MSAVGDVVTFACRQLPALVHLGRPVLLKLRRLAERQAERAKVSLESMGPSTPLHQFEAAQARVRRAAEAVTRYGDALRLIETSRPSDQGR